MLDTLRPRGLHRAQVEIPEFVAAAEDDHVLVIPLHDLAAEQVRADAGDGVVPAAVL